MNQTCCVEMANGVKKTVSTMRLLELFLYVLVNNFWDVGTFPGFKQYKAEDKVSCPRTQHSASNEAKTIDATSSTLAICVTLFSGLPNQ